MPPCGNLYGIPVYVAASLAENREIAFNAGTRDELMKLSFQDYQKHVDPEVIPLSGDAPGTGPLPYSSGLVPFSPRIGLRLPFR